MSLTSNVVRLLSLTCLVGIMVACQPTPADPPQKVPKTLYYFTWSDYVDRETLSEFERSARVRIVVDTFSSNEELLAKLQSGADGYDVVVPSDYMVSIMQHQDLLAELDLRKIPNVRMVAGRLQRLRFDPDNRHAIPYLWGTVGIGYDSSVIPSPPESWSVLWDARYKGRISMLNDQREVLGVALRELGYSMNTQDAAIIERAKDRLLAQKPLVKTYTSENYDHLLASGEVVLAHGWGGAVARAMAERPSVKFVVPREGGTVWADCLVILRSSKNKDLAAQFVNFLLDRDVAARTSNRVLFASANGEAREVVRKEVRENPAVYPPDWVFDRLEWMTDVGKAIRLYDRAWTELKMR